MKKTFLIVLFAILLSAFSTCYAKNGDVIGAVYSTDIKAYVNGVEVKAYNIGGRTAIPIEYVTKSCSYDDGLRTLMIHSLDPNYLIKTNTTKSVLPVGTKIGNIYETDIKVYLYDQILPSYNIGGVTAVAIEDLGLDNTFSNRGGKFVWNPAERTISLEYMYMKYPHEVLDKYNFNLQIINDNAHFTISPTGNGGFSTHFKDKALAEATDMLLPIYYNNETIIGYILRTPSVQFYYDNNENMFLKESNSEIAYFYDDVIEEIIKSLKVPELTTDEIISAHLESWLAEVKLRIDGPTYTFLYLTQPTPHGQNELLFYVRDNGTYEYLHNQFDDNEKATRAFSDFELNKNTETIAFTCLNTNERYEFNMRNYELKKI